MEQKQKKSIEETLVGCWTFLRVLQIQKQMNKLVQTHQIKRIKKQIARILTKLNTTVRHE